MTYLSVCSGIEAASVAWEPLGFKPVGFAEIEPFPCELLKQKYPTVKNYGDITNYKWRGKPKEQCPDSHRYKAIGNSMAVPVMRWLGERIKMIQGEMK